VHLEVRVGAGAVQDAGQQRDGGGDPEGALAQLGGGFGHGEHLVAVDPDPPAVHHPPGDLAQQPAQAHLLQRLDAQRHQALAAEHPAGVRGPFEQAHPRAVAGQQQRQRGPGRSGSDDHDPHRGLPRPIRA
jgi:hypothetical protein